MKTEFNLTGGVCVCWLIPLFLRRNSPGPTPHSHNRTPHIHADISRKEKGKKKREKPRLPLLSKSHDFIFRLFVTQINHQQTTAVQAGL